VRRHVKASFAGSSTGSGNGCADHHRARATRAAFGDANGSGAPSLGRAALLLAFALTALLVLAPSAWAAKKAMTEIGKSGSTGGAFSSEGGGVALNKTGAGGVPAGTFYAVDSFQRRVEQFKPNGEFAAAFGADVGGAGIDTCTQVGSCQGGTFGSDAGEFGLPEAIAVDQATGTVYVSDRFNRRIAVYSSTGSFEGAFGWGAVDGTEAFQYCTTSCSEHGAFPPESGDVPGGQFGNSLRGLAVDGSGKVFVANGTSRRIDVFTPTFAGGVVTAVSFKRAYGWGALTGASAFEVCEAPATCHAPAAPGEGLGQFGAGSPTDVAVESSGFFYALDAANRRVEKFNVGAPVPPPTFDASVAIGNTFGLGTLYNLAFDDATERLFVSGNAPSQFGRVLELNPSGAAVPDGVHGANLKTVANTGLAVAPPSLGGNLYFVKREPERVVIIGEAPQMNPISTFGATTATFSGKVVSNNSPVSYHFEYSEDGVEWVRVPAAADVSVPPSPGTVTVSQKVIGLDPSRFYRVKLVQSSPVVGFTATSDEVTFNARGPLLTNTAINWASVNTTSATVGATINPQGEGTSYRVEYVTEKQFEQSGFAGASKVPSGIVGIGNGNSNVPVSVQITGLTPATIYHFRFTAVNDSASVTGPQLVFRTFPDEPGSLNCANASLRVGFPPLPDCRAYEQVSPTTDKHGSNIQHSYDEIMASRDGSRVTFLDANGLPTGGGSSRPNVYLGVRGSGSWATKNLRGLTEPGFTADILGWNDDLTSTLGTASTKPTIQLTFGDTANEIWTQVGGAPRSNERSLESVVAQFARDDREHVLFESGATFAPGGVDQHNNLYEFDHGTVRYAARVPVFPATSCDDNGAPACIDAPLGGFAGPYGWKNSSDLVQYGGAAAGYYQRNAMSDDGSKIFFTEVGTGRIYMREDQARTTQISVSQRTTPDPNGSKPAVFIGATPDGSAAFFLSCEKLTDDSTAISNADNTCLPIEASPAKKGQDLYRYDTETGALTDLTVDSNVGDALRADVGGVLGYSADGSDVYFMARGVLAQGAAPGAQNVYLSHDGVVSLVAQLNPVSGASETSEADNWLETRPNGPSNFRTSRVSANGTLLFTTANRLSSYDSGAKAEIYRYQPGDAAPLCVSCSPSLSPATADAALHNRGDFSVAYMKMKILTRNVSADGNRAFFESLDRLVPADNNGVRDVYEWEAQGTGSCTTTNANGGCLYLVSSGTSPNPSFFGDASVSGDDAFVFTSSQLVPQDLDDLVDAYDARIGGGLAGQHPAPPIPPCEGEACRGASTAAPGASGAGTAVFQGPGNQTGKKPVKKHHKKKHHKKHQKKSSKKRAAHNRGGAK
jgi:hypothetical protein